MLGQTSCHPKFGKASQHPLACPPTLVFGTVLKSCALSWKAQTTAPNSSAIQSSLWDRTLVLFIAKVVYSIYVHVYTRYIFCDYHWRYSDSKSLEISSSFLDIVTEPILLFFWTILDSFISNLFHLNSCVFWFHE